MIRLNKMLTPRYVSPICKFDSVIQMLKLKWQCLNMLTVQNIQCPRTIFVGAVPNYLNESEKCQCV